MIGKLREVMERLRAWPALGAAVVSLWAGGASAQSTAFFYGPSLPEELLRGFERVVVEPGHGFSPGAPEAGRAELVAYLSVGEVAKTSPDRAKLDPSWVLSENSAWNSVVVDLASASMREHFLRTRFEPLWQRGFHSFFLDTLDSYMLVEQGRDAQRAGLVALIQAMHARHPEVKLLLNRGFEVLPELASIVHGVVAESLFDRFDAATGSYVRVPAQDRAWLSGKLREAHERYGLTAIVIDYRPIKERAQALETARQIQALGFMPYVTDGALSSVGTGEAQLVPRKVLVLTNHGDPLKGRPRQVLGPLLEYLGYVPTYADVSEALPSPVAGTLRGVVSWFEGRKLAAGYADFIQAQETLGVRLVFFGEPRVPLQSQVARTLGLSARGEMLAPLRVVADDEVARADVPQAAMVPQLPHTLVSGKGVRPHLSVVAKNGVRLPVVATAPWGGVALSHFLVPRGLHGEEAFAIDPVAFLQGAFSSTHTPSLDLTTADGQRVASVVVRAAGLSEASRLPGRPANVALLSKLMRRHRVPHTLDLEPSETNTVTAADRRRASGLLRSPLVERASPQPSLTVRLSTDGSLAQLTGQLPSSDGQPSPLPLAGDYRYIPEGVQEAYPFRRLAETLRRTDTPYRLCPAVIDYHASSLGSPGGYEAIDALYGLLESEDMRVLSYTGLRERARDFASQLLVRHVDGGYELRNAGSLRSVRLPPGTRVSDGSRGVRSVRALSQGTFVSFERTGEHRLYLEEPASRPATRLSRGPEGSP